MRWLPVWLLISVVSLNAQRAQLGRKGRVRETGPGFVAEPIRKLPRRSGLPAELKAGRTPLDLYLDKLRAGLPPARPLPADRVRPLVRAVGVATPLAMIEPASPLYPRPRRAPEPFVISGLPADFVVPARPAEDPRVPSRWRIGFPSWRRYENTKLDAIYASTRWWDPYNQRTIKGDFPVMGRRQFLNFTGSSETTFDGRRLPTPGVQSAAEPGGYGFFGRGGQVLLRQNFRTSFDLFRGSAGFAPVDWEFRITPEFSINYLRSRENGIVRVDVRERTGRLDTAVGLQEAFFEKRFGSNSTRLFRRAKNADDRGSAYYDFTSLRMGIQRFTSDFRGFIFSDEQPGARLFGTFHNNVFQYNLAFFRMLEKDTNSGLNRLRQRNQSVYAANLYWQDFLTQGYNLNFSALYNNDQPTYHIDRNGFLVRPAPIGAPAPHKIRAGYAGISGDGHIGRINVSHAFYQAFGNDSFHPIPARNNRQAINAQLAAAEIAYERDWATYKASFFFTSGDGDISDGRARGFDGIVPNQQFAGGGFLGPQNQADRGLINNLFEGGGTNFLNRQLIPLTGTGVLLFGINSLMPTMRSSPFQGQANFINPGIMLGNAGMDAKITPKLRSTINVNYARFHRTEVLQAVLFQSGIRHAIGVDSGFGLQYRPYLNENLVITGGIGTLFPGAGFKNLSSGRTLFSGFVSVRLVF